MTTATRQPKNGRQTRTIYRYDINGKKVKVTLPEPPVLDARNMAKRRGRVRRRAAIGGTQSYAAGTPGTSMGMGCHRTQIDLLNNTVKAHGIAGVEYVPGKHGGKCVITSRRGRAQWMKVFGEMHGLGSLHDNDGGYGDG